MARVRIMFWKEIPYAVRAQDAAGQANRSLPQAFQEAIDQAAMNTGETSAEAYQAGFHWGAPEEQPGTAVEAADAAVATLVADYPAERLAALARGGA